MPQQLTYRRPAESKRPMWKSKDVRRYRLALLGGGLLLAAAAIAMALAVWSKPTPGRVANNTLRLAWSPPSETAWTTENAYPKLKFFEPTCVAFAADGSRRVFVLERRGTVQMFQDEPRAEAYAQILDISPHVWRTPYEDDGAVAIALHPEFGREGSPHKDYFYLLYTAKIAGRRYDRLSRFTLVGASVRDELVLIEQLDEDLWHNGGGLAFGPDGFLYVGVGDEGTDGDGLENGQRLDRDLFCGILRIDVDRRGADVSHPPRRQPETGATNGYFIPSDNPFVGVAGVLEEFWAHGLRNPFRIAFDAETGRLWAADVGHLRREEINHIRPGGNYGWSYREGTLPFTESYLHGEMPAKPRGEQVDPVWEYSHLNGNNCIIGGFVYRGALHPQLHGKYIYADNGSGRVWALHYDGEKARTNEQLLSLPVSSKTGIAAVQPDAQGEPLIIILGQTGARDGTIRRIVPANQSASQTLPRLLSETGVFADVNSLIPNPGVIPYEVNASQSAGAARIRRWMAVPGDGLDPHAGTDRIVFAEEGAWNFPSGTVFVQHFDLPLVGQEGTRIRPIETRLLVRHSGKGVYSLSYRWNDEGDDAQLVTTPQFAKFRVKHAKSATREQTWQFLDRQTCLACHNANAGYILSVNARQLNRPFAHHGSGQPGNQLLALSREGYFDNPLDDAAIAALPKLVAPDDQSAKVDHRARSYLDVNCASCHREGGARANYFAEFHRTADANSLDKSPLQGDFGIAGAKIVAPSDPFRSVLYYRMAKLGQGRMPFVGAHDLDVDGLQLVREWIEQMPPSDDDPASRAIQDESIDRLRTGAIISDEADVIVAELLSDTRGALALWQTMHEGAISEPTASEIVGVAGGHHSAAVRDLFEWFIEASSRTQRLGTQFDPLQVLQHAGNVEQGRKLYADAELVTCGKCHATQPSEASIGPSLWGIGRKYSREELLRHIHEPSWRIDPQYAMWTVATTNGRLHHGLLVARSEAEVVLRDEQNREHHIKSTEIDFMEEQKLSLMPDHLLQSLTPTQVADLLAYLRSLQ